MVDTHCHLGLCEPQPAELVADARAIGVRRMLTVGIDEDSSREAIAIAEAHEEVFASVGRHPNGAGGFDERSAATLAQLATHERVVAIGESGLDFYRDRAPREDQRRAFLAQIEIAKQVAKPLVIHVRDGAGSTDGAALEEAFAILREHAEGVVVILHCFSAPPGRVAEAAARSWHCSFAGNLTYPSASALRESARLVPEELLLVETDAPFLAPQPVRGRPNQPSNVVATAETLAEERAVGYAEIDELLERNAARVFGW